MRQTLSKAKLPSLQLAVWSKPPLFMAQSSRFTKTTPRFPLADLRIPAAQPLSIQSSGPGRGGGGRGGGEPTDVWRPEPETKLPRSQRAHQIGPRVPNLGASVPSPVPQTTLRTSRQDPTPWRSALRPLHLSQKANTGEKTLEADPTLSG